jgi:hypothetical protein
VLGVRCAVSFAVLLSARCSLLCLNAQAATFFVHKGSSGNGTSWANAWGELSSISWGSLSAGSTVCIAGGSYSGSIKTGANGASGNPITLKRAVASDPACGSSTAGWSSAFDAQVLMSGTITLQNNYVTIDGMVPNGISLIIGNPGAGSYYTGIGTDSATTGITLRYIELAGPCPNGQGCAQNGDHRPIQLEHWNGSNWDTHSNWLIQYANIHGACNNMVIYGAQNLIVEHSRFADSNTTGNTANCHPNVVNTGSSNNVTWRYNEITNWQVEGIMLLGGSGQWNIYGNLWHDPMSGSYPRVVETQEGAEGPVLFYNNTLVNLYYLCGNVSGGTWASGSQARNNLYWNDNSTPCGLASEDYDYSDKSLSGEAHGQGGAANPFVNLSGKDFHLARATTAGQTLASPYNVDYDGSARGGDGAWDRGAYEFGSGAPPPPPPPPSGSVCDVNADGTTNVVDVQQEVNQALGIATCKGDINKDGQCTVVDVQRVVNAALGGQCVSQ